MPAWTTIETIGSPHARHECGFIEFHGKLYLIGGRRVQVVDIFDPSSATWTSASAPPIEIHHFQPIVVNNQIWLVGAMTGDWPRETPLDDILIYEPHTDSWIIGPSIPADRRRGAAGCVYHSDGLIYLAGGIIDGHHSGTQAWLDCINPDTGQWQKLRDAPNKRDHAPCITLANKLYFLGGRETGRHNGTDYDAVFASTINDVDVYDVAQGTWCTHTQSLPIPTAAGSAVKSNQVLMYVGGESEQPDASADLQIFDSKSGKWSIGPSLNQARHGTNCCLFNNALWIASGSGAQGGSPELTSIECLSISNQV